MKKYWKIPVFLIAGLVLVALAYVGYAYIAYYRLPDCLELTVDSPQTALVRPQESYSMVSFNIGFGAYEPDFGFFMDGGSESWAYSEERLTNNMNAIGQFLSDKDADFLTLQEVDTDATRTYHVQEQDMLNQWLTGYSSVFAQNWDSPYLLYPLKQPHGKNKSGILTLSRFQIASSLRRSLPIEDGLIKIVDYDRCYTISRLPVSNGRELVLYNAHLSAYTSDGTIAVTQLRLLLEDMQQEYEAGNYVICGGDFNKDLPGNSADLFGEEGYTCTWAQPFPTALLEEFDGLALQIPMGEEPVPTCRNADGPYSEDQYVLIVDGFLTSANVSVDSVFTLDTGFAYSDHNPVQMVFSLLP